MDIVPVDQLISKKCLPCEGGVDACTVEYSQSQIRLLPTWTVIDSGKSIARSIRFKNFVEAISCLNQIGDLAEEEAHHPDLHLTGYRHLKVELTTHAIGGLSENDFILAAKIDLLVASRYPSAKHVTAE